MSLFQESKLLMLFLLLLEQTLLLLLLLSLLLLKIKLSTKARVFIVSSKPTVLICGRNAARERATNPQGARSRARATTTTPTNGVEEESYQSVSWPNRASCCSVDLFRLGLPTSERETAKATCLNATITTHYKSGEKHSLQKSEREKRIKVREY